MSEAKYETWLARLQQIYEVLNEAEELTRRIVGPIPETGLGTSHEAYENPNKADELDAALSDITGLAQILASQVSRIFERF